jgi:hemerythrin superfamily protein
VEESPVAKRPDALSVLTHDHRAVEQLFKRFEKTTDRALKTRAELVSRMLRELSVHAAIEEQLLYPRLRIAGEKLQDEVLEGLEEHHVVKELLAEIERMTPEDGRYEAKVTVLMENVRHHIKEEEGEMFPRARRALTAEELSDIGEGLEALKTLAPTRPHPNAPDEPPANLANLGVAGLDRARDGADAVVEATGRVVRQVRDAVGRER